MSVPQQSPWWNPYGQNQSMLGAKSDPTQMQQYAQQPPSYSPDYGPQAGAPWMMQKVTTPQQPQLAGGPPPSTPSGTSTTYMQTQPNQQQNATAQPQVAGNVGYGNYKYGNANPTTNKFGFGFAAPGAGASFGSYLYGAGYNPQQDTYRHMIDQGGAGHGHDMNSWNRVYGWANEFAKANGYSDIAQMSPDAWQKAANYAIGRLRTDMMANDPSGQQWQQSGFAGADKYLAQGGAGGTGGTGGTGGGGTGGTGGGGTGAGGGQGKFTADQIAAAMTNPNVAFDLYNYATTGSSERGHGPFARHFEQWFQPVVMAAMNALGGQGGPQKLTSADVERLFSQLNEGVKGGNIFQQTTNLARGAMDPILNGEGGKDYDTVRNNAQVLSPLMMLGLTPIWQDMFQGGQQDVFSQMYDQALAKGGDYRGTGWGQYYRNSPFYRQFYGG